MIVSTKQSETLSSLKPCKVCGSAPIVSKSYNLFNSPGDLYTYIVCPVCGRSYSALTDNNAANRWNKEQEVRQDERAH